MYTLYTGMYMCYYTPGASIQQAELTLGIKNIFIMFLSRTSGAWSTLQKPRHVWQDATSIYDVYIMIYICILYIMISVYMYI